MDETCVSEHQWFVMRDLKRPNAKLPAYKELAKAGFRVFTPLITKVVEYAGKRKRVEVPFVQDLLFVFSEKETLDKVVARTDTLQYRFVKGAAYCSPMVVSVRDMERFIAAVFIDKTLHNSIVLTKYLLICLGPQYELYARAP